MTLETLVRKLAVSLDIAVPEDSELRREVAPLLAEAERLTRPAAVDLVLALERHGRIIRIMDLASRRVVGKAQLPDNYHWPTIGEVSE